jgi:hypothetical protein
MAYTKPSGDIPLEEKRAAIPPEAGICVVVRLVGWPAVISGRLARR